MTEADTKATRERRTQFSRRMVTTAMAWVGAYLTVNLVTFAGGHTLAAAPPALRTLVVSGALVIVMANALMPLIARTVARLFGTR